MPESWIICAANPNGTASTGWFRYSTANPGTCNDTFGTATSTTSLGAGTSSVAYSQAIVGLAPATTYYYCAIAASSVGTSFGAVRTFTTQAPPSVTTVTPSAIGSTTATLEGTASPNGVATTAWFRYSTTHPGACDDDFGTRAPASGGASIGSGASSVPFSETITGLTPGATYYYCAIASSAAGTSFGSVLSFTTPATPVVTTELASGRLPAELVARIGADVASALAYAHGRDEPVLHRALTPDAIDVDPSGVARVASFALPAVLVAAAATHSELLEHTCRYTAPEHAKHARPSPASDVFALGTTLYEALAGKPAFDAPTALAVVLKISMGAHTSIDSVAPSAPPRLRELITRMLSLAEADRPSAAEVERILRELAGDDEARAALGRRVRPGGAVPPAPAAPAPAAPAVGAAAPRSAPPPPLVSPEPRAASPAPAAPRPTPATGAPRPSPPPVVSAPPPPPAWPDDGEMASEPTRLDIAAPPDDEAERASEPAPPPVGAPSDSAFAELEGEATAWDARVPDAPIEATSPGMSLPFEPPGEDEGLRPITVEKTVQIAMPAATAALFADGRPTMPVAPPTGPHDARRATQPVDPAQLGTAVLEEAAGASRPRRVDPAVLLYVGVGVGAVGLVALVAWLTIWLVS